MILYGFSGLLKFLPAFRPVLGIAQYLSPRSLCARL